MPQLSRRRDNPRALHDDRKAVAWAFHNTGKLCAIWLGNAGCNFGLARLKPGQGRWHVICVQIAAQRFATPSCFLHILLLNDCPFLHREGHFSTQRTIAHAHGL
jgi:hypothetical protein